MKGILASVIVFVLLISACGSAGNGAATAPATTGAAGTEIQVESSGVPSAPTHTAYPTHTPPPVATATPTTEPTTTVAATETPYEPTATPTPTAFPTAPPAPQEPAPATPTAQASAGEAVALTRLEDNDPSPPFTVLVSAIRIKENGYYKLTGTVRNDGDRVYGGVGVGATFFADAQPPNWHRTGKVYAACQLLAPGAECPFSLEIYPRDYVSYHLHPDAAPVEYRQPVSLDLSNVRARSDGVGHVRITGTATNGNAFAVRDANVAGTLIDATGKIVSVGTTIVPGEIPPEASVDFDLRIEHAPYTTYELQAQATQN
jgi:hypothetical protein